MTAAPPSSSMDVTRMLVRMQKKKKVMWAGLPQRASAPAQRPQHGQHHHDSVQDVTFGKLRASTAKLAGGRCTTRLHTIHIWAHALEPIALCIDHPYSLSTHMHSLRRAPAVQSSMHEIMQAC